MRAPVKVLPEPGGPWIGSTEASWASDPTRAFAAPVNCSPSPINVPIVPRRTDGCSRRRSSRADLECSPSGDAVIGDPSRDAEDAVAQHRGVHDVKGDESSRMLDGGRRAPL